MPGEEEVKETKPDEEAEATRMGWAPKDKFRGDPEKWVDAKTFVERGKNMIPLLKENLERMSTKYGAMETELKEVKKTASEFLEFSRKSEERAYQRAKKEYDREVATLKVKMKAAVKSGDSDAYEELEATMNTLEAPEKPETPAKDETRKETKNTDETPELKAWMENNKWFNADKRMTKYAISVEADIAAENPGKNQAEILELISDEVKTRFPEKFKNQNREKGNSVDTGETEGRRKSSGKRTFDDLPQEAKDAYKNWARTFKESGKEYTKEEYLKNYEWDEEA